MDTVAHINTINDIYNMNTVDNISKNTHNMNIDGCRQLVSAATFV